MRANSEVPFMPLGWMQERYYPNAQFEDAAGALPTETVVENTFELGAVLPGFRGGDIETADNRVRFESKLSLAFTLAGQFRP